MVELKVEEMGVVLCYQQLPYGDPLGMNQGVVLFLSWAPKIWPSRADRRAGGGRHVEAPGPRGATSSVSSCVGGIRTPS